MGVEGSAGISRRWCYGGAAVLLLIAALLVFGFRSLGAWVAGAAAAPVRADLIVSLGGDDGHRVKKSAELFRAGYATSVLITGLEGSPVQERGHYLNWRAKALAAAGIAADSVLADATATNSFEEAQATLAVMRRQGWRKVLVVSDPPHMRRLDWAWGKVFAGSGLSYVLVASEPAWWDAAHWWRSERAGQFVLSEVVKLGYYVWKY